MFNKLNDKTAITGLQNKELMNEEKKVMSGGGEAAGGPAVPLYAYGGNGGSGIVLIAYPT